MARVNVLLVISLLVILISVGGLVSTYGSLADFVGGGVLTGYLINNGSVNVTVSSSVSVNLTSDNVNWGSGLVDDGETNATIDTEGNVERGNWSALSEGLVVKNIGNVAATLEINSDKNASQFLGGTNPYYQYKITNVDDGACTPSSGFSLGAYYEINTTAVEVCSSFTVNESINVDFRLVIPSNSSAGALSSTITVGYGAA